MNKQDIPKEPSLPIKIINEGIFGSHEIKHEFVK